MLCALVFQLQDMWVVIEGAACVVCCVCVCVCVMELCGGQLAAATCSVAALAIISLFIFKV